jgi:hypothetical protein
MFESLRAFSFRFTVQNCIFVSGKAYRPSGFLTKNSNTPWDSGSLYAQNGRRSPELRPQSARLQASLPSLPFFSFPPVC